MAEDEKFTTWLTGAPLGEPWVRMGGPAENHEPDQWVFRSAADDSARFLYDLYAGADTPVTRICSPADWNTPIARTHR